MTNKARMSNARTGKGKPIIAYFFQEKLCLVVSQIFPKKKRPILPFQWKKAKKGEKKNFADSSINAGL